MDPFQNSSLLTRQQGKGRDCYEENAGMARVFDEEILTRISPVRGLNRPSGSGILPTPLSRGPKYPHEQHCCARRLGDGSGQDGHPGFGFPGVGNDALMGAWSSALNQCPRERVIEGVSWDDECCFC